MGFQPKKNEDPPKIRTAVQCTCDKRCNVNPVFCSLGAVLHQQRVRDVCGLEQRRDRRPGQIRAHVQDPARPGVHNNPAPYTRSLPNPKPQTPNPKPQSPNPKPQTINPKPQTTNHKPQTTNHKPQTTNHKPQTTNHKPQALTIEHHGSANLRVAAGPARGRAGHTAARFFTQASKGRGLDRGHCIHSAHREWW
jgi:CD68 antigen